MLDYGPENKGVLEAFSARETMDFIDRRICQSWAMRVATWNNSGHCIKPFALIIGFYFAQMLSQLHLSLRPIH